MGFILIDFFVDPSSNFPINQLLVIHNINFDHIGLHFSVRFFQSQHLTVNHFLLHVVSNTASDTLL